MENILILGAGFGGLQLASRLSEAVADKVRVTLIDKNDTFVFGFSKPEVMLGRQSIDDVRLRYRDVEMPSVEFKQEQIIGIDPAARKVTTDRSSYEADVLVVALGADYDIEATPGLAEGGLEFYSVAGAARVAEALATFDGGSVVVGVLGVPFKCPPAPYEAALLLHDHFTQRGIRADVQLQVITPMDSPIPVSEQTSAVIVEALAERGIGYVPGERIVRLDPQARTAELGSGSQIPYDLFLGVPVHRVPEVVEASGLTEGGNEGWIAVDKTNLATRFEGVYAIGDNADPPVPRAGVFAENAADVVAEHLIARLRGTDDGRAYEGRGTCYIEFGGGLVGMVAADFLSGPVPQAPFTGPSRQIAGQKEAFASERRRRWFPASP